MIFLTHKSPYHDEADGMFKRLLFVLVDIATFFKVKITSLEEYKGNVLKIYIGNCC